MSIVRSCGLLLAFGVIAVLLVHLRAQQTRSTAAIMRIESQWVHVRRELWSVRVRTARLRAPQRIRHRIERFDPDLLSPEIFMSPPRSQGVVAGRL